MLRTCNRGLGAEWYLNRSEPFLVSDMLPHILHVAECARIIVITAHLLGVLDSRAERNKGNSCNHGPFWGIAFNLGRSCLCTA